MSPAKNNTIGILGGGKIGKAIFSLVDENISGIPNRRWEKELSIKWHDANPQESNCDKLDVTNPTELTKAVSLSDGIVCALPFRFNKLIMDECAKQGKSYFDFSEDTESAAYAKSIGKHFNKGNTIIPQCGLAPGFVTIVANHLATMFDDGLIISMKIRVGALPTVTTNQMKYYLSWSPAGLVNQYIKLCDGLHNGQPVKLKPLDGIEDIIINGIPYESFNTSGGLGTLHENYVGKIQTLEYKTIRYPGHRNHMKFLLDDLNLKYKPDVMELLLSENTPYTTQDEVIILIDVVGYQHNVLTEQSWYRKIGQEKWAINNGSYEASFTANAIQVATAKGMAGVLQLWAGRFDGYSARLKQEEGYVDQSLIDLIDFSSTKHGRPIAGTLLGTHEDANKNI